MIIRVKSDFLVNESGQQTLDFLGLNVSHDNRPVGKIVNSCGDYVDIELVDPLVIRLIENGMFDEPVSMGYKVNGGETDKKATENKVHQGYGNIDRLKMLKIIED